MKSGNSQVDYYNPDEKFQEEDNEKLEAEDLSFDLYRDGE